MRKKRKNSIRVIVAMLAAVLLMSLPLSAMASMADAPGDAAPAEGTSTEQEPVEPTVEEPPAVPTAPGEDEPAGEPQQPTEPEPPVEPEVPEVPVEEGAEAAEEAEEPATEFTVKGFEGPYDGTEHLPAVSGGKGLVVLYSESEDGAYGEEPIGRTNAGTTELWVKAMKGEAPAFGPEKVTIKVEKAPASLQLSYKGADGTLNTNPVWAGEANMITELEPIITGAVNGEALDYSVTIAAPSWNNPQTHSLPMVQSVTLRVDPDTETNRNYSISILNAAGTGSAVTKVTSTKYSISYRQIKLEMAIPTKGADGYEVKYTYGEPIPNIWEAATANILPEEAATVSKYAAAVSPARHILLEWDYQNGKWAWVDKAGMYPIERLNSEEQLDVGVYPYYLRWNSNGDPDSTGQTKQNQRYNVGGALGNVYIVQRPVTIASHDAEKVYGQDDPAFTSTGPETVYGDVIDYGLEREPGEKVGSYPINIGVDHREYPNYAITRQAGNLTITPATLTLKGGSGSFSYNGSRRTVTSFTVDGLVDGDKLVAGINYLAAGTNTGSYNGAFTISASALRIENAAGEDVTDCYTILEEPGLLTITGGGTTPVTPTAPEGPVNPGTPPEAPTPVGFTPVAPIVPEADAPPVAPTQIPEAETALAGPDRLGEDGTPLARMESWALLNLIIAVLAGVFTILLLATALKRNRQQEETEEEKQARMAAQAARGEEPEETVRNKKSGLVWRILSVVAGLMAPIVFLLTEDIRLPMVFSDGWTLLMVILLVAQMVGMLLMKRARNQENDEAPEKA